MDGSDNMGLGVAGLGMPAEFMLDPSKAAPLGKPKGGPKRGPKAMKKASNAPKRFKSSFIFFSMAKHKEIKEYLASQGDSTKTTNITKMVSDAWRSMDDDERAKYNEMAREDKARYELEKATYAAPPGGGSSKKHRDPNAPKRPMSAFFAYANSRRGEVKSQNPDCTNGEISKLLSVMWKEVADDVKQKYRDNEAALWAVYKAGMVEWRKKNDGRKKALKAAQVPPGGKKKGRKKKSKDGEEMLVSGFDEHQFSGMSGGLDSSGNPNQDEMMAASALRGVRGGPNFPLGPGSGAGMGMNNPGLDMHNAQAGGGYGSLFGMNAMGAYGGVGNTGGASGGAGGFSNEMGNPNNRALLEMGFPYQQYGGYPGLGNSQAMLMAQALRGAPGAYPNQFLGLSDQQPPLSQLASLAGAGTQNGSSPGMGMGMGMGNLMNDNSDGRMNRMGMGDGGMGGGFPGAERF